MADNNQDINQLLKVRREKLAELQEQGNDPFTITKYDVTAHTQQIKDNYEQLEGKDVSIAGRMMSKRVMGKASFCNIQDRDGNIQCYVARDSIGEDAYKAFKKMDSGDIISQKSTPIHEDTTLDELYSRLSYLGRDLLIETLPSIINGTNDRIKQNEEEVTFGYNITKEEEKVNFNDNIDNIHNKIRGLSSIPGAYAIINNKRMKIYKSEKTNIKSNKEPGTIVDITSDGIYVTTLDYVIKLIDIKLEGKKRCLVKDFINGIKKEEYIGEVFE